MENPILNAPYDAPARHFRFDDDGITDEVVDGRRASSYFMPIPKAQKKGGQLVFDEWTGDRIEENRLINQIRDRVGRWRELGWPGVTPTTRALLDYWTDAERERPLFFCQIEALETAIYLTLWNDVVRVAGRVLKQPAAKHHPHFLGAVVVQQVQNLAGSLPERTIIDGQQRLTTLQILLDALHAELARVSDEHESPALRHGERHERVERVRPDHSGLVHLCGLRHKSTTSVEPAGSR